MTMALEMSSAKKGAIEEQQCETQPTRNEHCMPLRPEAETLGPACHGGIFHEGNHRHHRYVPSKKKKWQYTRRLLGMSSLKEGAM
jgi:hypothetical protein